MNEITKHKEKVAENIIKSFDCDIEKAFPIGTWFAICMAIGVIILVCVTLKIK